MVIGNVLINAADCDAQFPCSETDYVDEQMGAALSFEVPCRPPFEVPGDKIWDQHFQVLWVYTLQTPPTKTSNTTVHYHSKYEILSIEKKIVGLIPSKIEK